MRTLSVLGLFRLLIGSSFFGIVNSIALMLMTGALLVVAAVAGLDADDDVVFVVAI